MRGWVDRLMSPFLAGVPRGAEVLRHLAVYQPADAADRDGAVSGDGGHRNQLQGLLD